MPSSHPAVQSGPELGSRLTWLWALEYFHTQRLCGRLFSAPHAPTRDNGNPLLQTGGMLHFWQGKAGKLQPASHCAMRGHPQSKGSKGCLALGLKKGVTHTSDMA